MNDVELIRRELLPERKRQRHGHNPLSGLFTQPSDKVMRFIYKKNVRKEIASL